MWEKQPLKERCFSTSAPEKIFRNLQGDDSGFVIVRREWMAECNAPTWRIVFCPSIAGEKSLGCEAGDAPSTTAGKQNALSSKMPA